MLHLYLDSDVRYRIRDSTDPVGGHPDRYIVPPQEDCLRFLRYIYNPEWELYDYSGVMLCSHQDNPLVRVSYALSEGSGSGVDFHVELASSDVLSFCWTEDQDSYQQLALHAQEGQTLIQMPFEMYLFDQLVHVYVNGIFQIEGGEHAYSITASHEITFSKPLQDGDIVIICIHGCGVKKVYTLDTYQDTLALGDHPFDPDQEVLKVYVNGALQPEEGIYTVLEENTYVQFADPLVPGDTVVMSRPLGQRREDKIISSPTSSVFLSEGIMGSVFPAGKGLLQVYVNGALNLEGADYAYLEKAGGTPHQFSPSLALPDGDYKDPCPIWIQVSYVDPRDIREAFYADIYHQISVERESAVY